MTVRSLSVLPFLGRRRAAAPSLPAWLAAFVVGLLLAACGGSADAPPPLGGTTPPPINPTPVAPTITQQPADLAVAAGAPASFTVAATGDPTITYQWQRNGTAIAGATATTYTIAATVLADTGAVFRAVASNGAGSATSNNATLTVTTVSTPPVLTVSPQPANVSVTAGAAASFTVGGTCSAGTLQIQWQRGAGATFTDIAGATAATYTIASTATGDNGAQFRAALSCSGQAATTSNVATLTVTAPGSTTLSLYPIVGLRDQALIGGTSVIDQLADGSYAYLALSQLKKIGADRLSITPVTGVHSDGYVDGPPATAQFRSPQGMTHDSAGVLYIADTQNHLIRKVATDGTVSTLAGGVGQAGLVDGTGTAARFWEPSAIAMGPDGDLYVADKSNRAIRRVTTAGVVTTYAGSGTVGFQDGPAATAQFVLPFGITVASNGDVLVSDYGGHRVRRILRAGNTAGAVETLAGNGTFAQPGVDGPGSAAVIANPSGIVLMGGFAFVRDGNGTVRKIDLASKAVTTFAGAPLLGEGYADGPPGQGRLRAGGYSLTLGSAGGLVAADDNALRTIDAAGVITTFAYGGSGLTTDAGTGVLAQLPLTAGALAVDTGGNVVDYDSTSKAVRRIDASGNVTLVAGLTGGYAGVVEGQASAAQFTDAGLSIAAGPANVLYVAVDYGVMKIAADRTATVLAGSTTTFGAANGTGSAALFNRIFGLAVGPTGDVFAADGGTNTIRRITPAGVVTTYAGALGASGHVDGPVASARLQQPTSVAFAPDGTLYFADGTPGNKTLRKVSADGATVTSVTNGPPFGIVAMGADPSTGRIYCMVNADLVLPGGLWVYDPATDTSTRLIVAGTSQTTVLGSANPQLPVVQSIAVLGPKRIVLSGGLQVLLLTLP